MDNSIARFQISADEDFRIQFVFVGLSLAGRDLRVLVKERTSNAIRTTLTLGAGLTLDGTDTLTASIPQATAAAWSKGEFETDLHDVTGGANTRLVGARTLYDLPGRLPYGVIGSKATVQWVVNKAVVTAIGGIGPSGPANVLTIGAVETLPPGEPATASITGTAPAQVLNLGLPNGDIGGIGPAGTIEVNEVNTGAPGSPVIIENVGTPEHALLNITIPEGGKGDIGDKGDKGWSPVFAIIVDGARRVLQVTDWGGGEGTKPATGGYVGATGLTPTIGDAIDIRGPAGTATIPDGDKGDITTSDDGDTWLIKAGAVKNTHVAPDAAIAATKVGFTPAAGVSATDVQGAIEELGGSRTSVRVATRAAMSALSPDVKAAYLGGESGRNGMFVWNAADLSAFVTADPSQGIYVAPTSDATGASGAWVRDFDGAGVLDVWFGVVRGNVGATSGPDMRAELQAALDFCRARALDLRLTKGSAFVSQNGANAFCLLNEGVSMIGEPAKSTYSVIAPMPTVPNTADIIRFRPRANQDQDYIQFTRFMINPKQSGTAYGKRAFYMLTDNVCNVGQLLFSRMYCGSGNDYSLYLENSIAVNAQGNPSNAIISESSFFEGVWLAGVGDNISIRDSFIITAVGSARQGIYVYQVDGGGGVASFVLIERNAMNANGSAILVDRARNLRIRDNNIEHSAGSGVNTSVVNLRGSGGSLSMPIVQGNAIGIFGSSTALVGINVQACYFAQVFENNIITDGVRTHAVIVGASSTNTRVARNKVSPEWTNNLTDSGTGTLSSDFVESGI